MKKYKLKKDYQTPQLTIKAGARCEYWGPGHMVPQLNIYPEDPTQKPMSIMSMNPNDFPEWFEPVPETAGFYVFDEIKILERQVKLLQKKNEKLQEENKTLRERQKFDKDTITALNQSYLKKWEELQVAKAAQNALEVEQDKNAKLRKELEQEKANYNKMSQFYAKRCERIAVLKTELASMQEEMRVLKDAFTDKCKTVGELREQLAKLKAKMFSTVYKNWSDAEMVSLAAYVDGRRHLTDMPAGELLFKQWKNKYCGQKS